MKRKLVKHGEKTLMVSLPAKWLRNQDLKKGDEVEISAEDNVLTLSRERLMEVAQKIKIDLKPETPSHARAMLGNAYKLGYDEINVSFESQQQLNFIKKQLYRMIGFEITSLTKNSCVLKSVIVSTAEEYENIKKRAWHNIKSAFEILKSDMKMQKYPNEDVIMELFDNVLKYTDFCRRLINKHRFLDIRESCLEYACLLKLVYTIPLIRDIYQHLVKNKIRLDNAMIDFAEEISDQFDKVYAAYYKKDINLTSKVIMLRKNIRKQSEILFKKPSYALIVSKLMEIEKLCYGFTGHINGLVFIAESSK